MMQPLWKSVWGLLEKNKNRITIGPSTSILGTYPKEDICTPTFIAALLMIVRRRKQPKCPLMDVVYTCSRILFRLKRKEILIHLQRGWTLKTLCSMKEARQERTNTVWFHLRKVSRVVTFVETESRMLITRAWGSGELLFTGIEYRFCKMQKFYITLWTYLIPLNCVYT